MSEYHVTWTIDIFEASTPMEAAQQALDIQRNPESVATIFTVTDENGVTVEIDLTPEESEETVEAL